MDQLRQVLKPNFAKGDEVKIKNWTGLVTVVVQNVSTKEVLMVAFANEAAVKKTLETGMATFFTRSRGKLWTKGEESGNFMKVVEVRIDCDGDALLYLVEPQGDGLACHTLAPTCFYRNLILGAGPDYKPPNATADENLDTMCCIVAAPLMRK